LSAFEAVFTTSAFSSASSLARVLLADGNATAASGRGQCQASTRARAHAEQTCEREKDGFPHLNARFSIPLKDNDFSGGKKAATCAFCWKPRATITLGA
jgi:hypothetical protein